MLGDGAHPRPPKLDFQKLFLCCDKGKVFWGKQLVVGGVGIHRKVLFAQEFHYYTNTT